MQRPAGLPVSLLCLTCISGCSLIPGVGKPRVAEDTSRRPGRDAQAQTAPGKTGDRSAKDPIATLLATSEQHYANGERELRAGHLDRARREFDQALRVITESPWGARSDARLSEHFDRLVDRISAQEALALATGDGFTEKPSEPALIDKVLEITTFNPPLPAKPGVQETVARDLAATAHDIPIPQNNRVLQYVQLFQTRLRDTIESGLARGHQYLPMIQEVFRAEGIPLDLAYIPLIESAFKPTALSRARAKGVWQFMRGTAAENGLETNWFVDERADPEKATQAAARYLKTLRTMFEGDWLLALASYNGGPGRVQRAIRRAGTSDFWRLSGTTRYLPRETREYVPMILAAIIVARSPAQYGFAISGEPPVDYDKVAVSRAVDLRRVAEWTGVSIDEIQALNPELRRWTTPLRASNYELKVPQGTADQLRARLVSAERDELASLQWYTVRRGDSLSKIASKLKVRQSDLSDANSLAKPYVLQIGEQLVVPRAPASTLLASRAERGGTSLAAAKAGGSGEPDGQSLTYRVRRGDTLYDIARAFEVSVADLKTWNGLRSSRLDPGDRLTIYPSRSARAAQ
ncbi:MAG: LysM peptidoglycan-binding domain-containing protein [Luteitalea sp.]|nr:LysM peptidoglycan-binding domain-containing protein [Luteitalea sp.]